jgi:hypothetical protein
VKSLELEIRIWCTTSCPKNWRVVPSEICAKKSNGTSCIIAVSLHKSPDIAGIDLYVGGEVPRLVAVEGQVDEDGRFG